MRRRVRGASLEQWWISPAGHTRSSGDDREPDAHGWRDRGRHRPIRNGRRSTRNVHSAHPAGWFFAEGDRGAIEAGKESSLGRVGLEVAPRLPCLGEFNGPQFHESKLPGSRSAVSGIALEADAALTQATITLLAAGTHRLIGSTKTDQSGRSQFADVPSGSYQLWVSSDGPKLKLKVRRGHAVEVRLTWKAWPQEQLCL